MIKVLFVCLGNICRSPTAHGVFQQMINDAEMSDRIHVDSCGTGSWHIGHSPDERMQKTAAEKGYDLSQLVARRLSPEDFDRFDYILAMDTRNLADIIKQAPMSYTGRIQLFMDYSEEKKILEVPDPYYGGEQGFTHVVTLIEGGCQGLFDEVVQPVHA